MQESSGSHNKACLKFLVTKSRTATAVSLRRGKLDDRNFGWDDLPRGWGGEEGRGYDDLGHGIHLFHPIVPLRLSRVHPKTPAGYTPSSGGVRPSTRNKQQRGEISFTRSSSESAAAADRHLNTKSLDILTESQNGAAFYHDVGIPLFMSSLVRMARAPTAPASMHPLPRL